MKDSIPRKVLWVSFDHQGAANMITRLGAQPKSPFDPGGNRWVKMYSRPQAKFIDDVTPRSDGRKGKPQGVTLGCQYDVLAENHQFYTIVNDKGNVCRYSKTRFELVVDSF